mmetsp:Transcript_39683/g.88822  ORF Transcript_39683/g.88822 Transcript_39683/m.88822 type:complete len:173 (+) Transcript_39683:329-847(+)
MSPGELVYYESAKCLHARNQPLRHAKAYANLFFHYRPLGDPQWFQKPNKPHTPQPVDRQAHVEANANAEAEAEAQGVRSAPISAAPAAVMAPVTAPVAAPAPGAGELPKEKLLGGGGAEMRECATPGVRASVAPLDSAAQLVDHWRRTSPPLTPSGHKATGGQHAHSARADL